MDTEIPSQQKMPIPGAGQPQPQGSPQAMAGSQQAERQSQRQVPKEQLAKALQTGADAVSKALYGNKKIRQAIMGMIRKDDKVGSTAKATTMMLSNLNKKVNLPPRTMVPLVTLAADEVMIAAEAANRAEYSEQEAKQVIMTSAEIVLKAYGVGPEQAKQLASRADKSSLQKAESTYKETLNG